MIVFLAIKGYQVYKKRTLLKKHIELLSHNFDLMRMTDYADVCGVVLSPLKFTTLLIEDHRMILTVTGSNKLSAYIYTAEQQEMWKTKLEKVSDEGIQYVAETLS